MSLADNVNIFSKELFERGGPTRRAERGRASISTCWAASRHSGAPRPFTGAEATACNIPCDRPPSDAPHDGPDAPHYMRALGARLPPAMPLHARACTRQLVSCTVPRSSNALFIPTQGTGQFWFSCQYLWQSTTSSHGRLVTLLYGNR